MFIGQQQRFFLPSGNNGNFAVPRGSFQEDVDSDEVIVPQRRLSSANPLPIQPNPGSSSFFPSQQQLPPGTFTNSGPFSRPPTAQFILNGQTQFQAVRSPGSLSFSETLPTVPQPSFFQQTPIQRPQQPQQQQQPPQQQQQFNFFQSNSQQQRFRPIVQQQDSSEDFEEQQNSQPSLVPQQTSQERFISDSSRRPLTQTSGVPGARNSLPNGSIRWWSPTQSDTESVSGNVNSDEESTVGPKDDLGEFNQQRQIQSQKRGRGPPQQEKRRPVITTHRPQSGPSSFRNINNTPTPVSGTIINRRPTTYNPSSLIVSTTTVKPLLLKPSESSETFNRQQPNSSRGRKPVLYSTTTTTEGTLEDEPEQEESLPVEEKHQSLIRKSTITTQSPSFPITTLRAAIRPKLNISVTSVPQQQRMKKIVNNPSIIQSVMVRKPILTSTSTITPKTTTQHQIVEEYEDYEDDYTTAAALTTNGFSNKPVTQPSTTKQQNNNTIMTTSESWFVVASVQTSRSVSSNSGNGPNKNHTVQEVTDSTTSNPINKHRFNNKSTLTTPSTTTVESIIDKLDRVQSELSNGILYGSSSNTNNSSRILTEIQSSSNTEDKRNDAIIPFFTTPVIEKMTETTTLSTTTITTPPPLPSTTTTTTTTTTKTTTEEVEDDDKEEEESDDSDKESTFVRKFVPSKGRTTPATITTVSTVKALTQTGKKKSLIDNVKFDELLTSGLLPPGFNPKPPPAYKSKIISSTTETPVSTSQPNITISTTINTTPQTSTTIKSKSSGLSIKFADDPSALAALLPPGFKLEDSIKPLDTLSPSLLPPGYKLPAENANTTNKNKEPETILTTIMPTTDVLLNTTTPTTIVSSSTIGLVFPNSGKGTNNSGTRKPLPSSKKIQASVTIAPVIQKGWPVR